MGKNRQIKAVDPFSPSARREQFQQRNVKKKVNAKPKNLDDQEIPFKLRELMKNQKEMNEPKKKRKRKGNKYNQGPKPGVPSIVPDIPVPKFKRQKKESVYNYIQRMESATKYVMFLTKSQPDRAPEKEDISVKKETQLEKPKKKEFNVRWQQRMLNKKTEKKVDRLEKEMFQDRVEFGEVAMQPPSFTSKPRKGLDNVKPGQRQLLLKRLLNHENTTFPRKKLPLPSLARQRIMEEERERVVEAYRALKKQRQLQQLSQNKQKATGKLKTSK